MEEYFTKEGIHSVKSCKVLVKKMPINTFTRFGNTEAICDVEITVLLKRRLDGIRLSGLRENRDETFALLENRQPLCGLNLFEKKRPECLYLFVNRST